MSRTESQARAGFPHGLVTLLADDIEKVGEMMLSLTAKQREGFRTALTARWKGPYPCRVIIKWPKAHNCYDSIDRDWQGRYGIYRFVDAQGNEAYVGEAHLQDLPTRVRQHLRASDSGGEFRIAIERTLGSKEAAMRYIAGCTLWFIETPPEQAVVFESIATLELDPDYSGYTWQKKESARRKAERAEKGGDSGHRGAK